VKSTKRAWRRHHRWRMVAHARRIAVFWLSGEDADNWARRNHNHLAACACCYCKNPRKWDGPTIQERRANQTGECEEP
jgi:hypothetical protein